ncbi:M24 family metallopeptidase [Paenibacillus aurantius]|uniref:M24 family metallopeptidase n=1 Tax=Paenibacillus aurantius TaxID=2918900 RepID=A0AA96RCR3_9BACL|nr:M24 family metallopeptidase [Paenibacillus aurantius]WNQ10810.1 M24 family metallopeptidase [Paenibacillus aurantius]
MEHLAHYQKVQSIAKATISELKKRIKEGISEKEIVFNTEDIMRKMGIEKFWYHGVGAFVHVGKRTIISESGRDYTPSEIAVGSDDIVTIDLSPEWNTFWGDFARTLIVINGKVIDEEKVEYGKNELVLEFSHGIHAEKELHKAFIDYVKPDMTFEQVYLHMNEVIDQLGYINLDFSGNLGHTIECHKDHRKYFEMGNKAKLMDGSYFTFEPHIKLKDGAYGYKWEDIYYFDNGELFVL